MVVEDADRFGLLQLHQLRGRIGRGDARVVLLPARRADDARRARRACRRWPSRPTASSSPSATSTIRGAGEVFGERQAGWTDLKLGRLPAGRAASCSRRAASPSDILDDDPDLEHHAQLREEVEDLLGDARRVPLQELGLLQRSSIAWSSGRRVMRQATVTTSGSDRTDEFFLIVPNSGTGELAGIRGRGAIVVDDDGERMVFDYTLYRRDPGDASRPADGVTEVAGDPPVPAVPAPPVHLVARDADEPLRDPGAVGEHPVGPLATLVAHPRLGRLGVVVRSVGDEQELRRPFVHHVRTFRPCRASMPRTHSQVDRGARGKVAPSEQ